MEMTFNSEPGVDPALKPEPETPEITPEGEEESQGKPVTEPERKLKGTEKETTDTSDPEEKPDVPEVEEVEAILEVAGLDMSELSKEYQKDGKLSEESYTELEEAGFPRAVVDAYIRGVTQGNTEAAALAEKDVDEILTSAGGREGYEKLMQWASDSFTDAEKEAYNRAVNMGDKYIAKLAVQGMVARYEAEYGHDPKLVNGGGRAVDDTKDGFKSRADMVAAMSDKRYGRDPDYTRDVEQKVANSKLMSSTRK